MTSQTTALSDEVDISGNELSSDRTLSLSLGQRLELYWRGAWQPVGVDQVLEEALLLRASRTVFFVSFEEIDHLALRCHK